MTEPDRYSGPARVAAVTPEGADAIVLRLDCPAVAAAAQPGQFVTLRFPNRTDPFLPRPFSVCDVEGETLLLLVRVVGRTTQLLARLRGGEALHLVGPLGRGFSPAAGEETDLLVGGGMGVAPLPYLFRRLGGRGRSEVRVLVGARTAAHLYGLGRFTAGATWSIVEEGAAGRRGMVTDLLAEALAGGGRRPAVYACGPAPMLEAVARLCLGARVPCQVSLEAMMACGTGLCQGCVVRLADGRYARVCTDGPVFDARELAIPWTT